MWTAPSVASRWNGASFRSSSERDRPAVVPVGGDEPAGVRLHEPGSARAARRLVAIGRRPVQRGDGLGERDACRGADGGVLLRSSSWALADHGISSQSRQDPVGLELVPRGRRPRRASRTRSRKLALELGVVEEPPAGAGVDDADAAVDDAEPLRAASSSRQTTTTAREPMCFSSQTTCGTPWLRK